MRAAAILLTIGLAAAASVHAETTDAHARAAALLNSTGEAIVPAVTLPPVATSAVVDAQARAADLLRRPIQYATTPSAPAEKRNRVTGAAPDAHDLARRLLGRSA